MKSKILGFQSASGCFWRGFAAPPRERPVLSWAFMGCKTGAKQQITPGVCVCVSAVAGSAQLIDGQKSTRRRKRSDEEAGWSQAARSGFSSDSTRLFAEQMERKEAAERPGCDLRVRLGRKEQEA